MASKQKPLFLIANFILKICTKLFMTQLNLLQNLYEPYKLKHKTFLILSF